MWYALNTARGRIGFNNFKQNKLDYDDATQKCCDIFFLYLKVIINEERITGWSGSGKMNDNALFYILQASYIKNKSLYWI